MTDNVINITVNDAGLGNTRFGVFCCRILVSEIGDPVPKDYLDKYVQMKFPSGLMLNCLGSDVEIHSKWRS